MSLILTSSHKGLDASLRRIDGDGATSPIELQTIRDQADEHIALVTGVSAHAESVTPLGKAISEWLSQADALVEGMQRIALEVRKTKLQAGLREALMVGIEHELGYVVAGFQSSIQRL